MLNTVLGLVVLPTEYPYVMTGLLKTWDDEPAESAVPPVTSTDAVTKLCSSFVRCCMSLSLLGLWLSRQRGVTGIAVATAGACDSEQDLWLIARSVGAMIRRISTYYRPQLSVV
jgi:hypothetical protein